MDRLEEIFSGLEKISKLNDEWYVLVKSLRAEVDRLRAALAALDEALWRVVEAAGEARRLTGHQHWDSTGQHGAGCEKCIADRPIVEKIREALAFAKGVMSGEGHGPGCDVTCDCGQGTWTGSPGTGSEF